MNPQPKSFFSKDELSFLNLGSHSEQKSGERTMNVKNTTTVSRVSGIPVDIDAAEVAQRHSRLFITDISKSDSTGNTAMSELVNDPTSSKSSPDSSNLTPKSAVSVIISRPDLKAIVSQDPTLRSLITTHKQTTDIKNFLPSSTVKSATTSFSSTSSTLRNTSSNLVTNPTMSSTIKPEGSLNNSLILPTIQKTRPDIPLLVGGGLALFIISLLIAIVVMLVRLKNRKGEDNISVRHDGSSRSNMSKDSEPGQAIQRVNSSLSRRDSKDSNVYSEIGSVIDEDENEDDFIYYWGESEWDSDSRHNSVISLSYSAKAERSRNSGLSVLGIPKRGRRKSSLSGRGRPGQRFPGSNTDLRKDRQSGTGTIFCIPEGEDIPIDKGKKIEINKDDMYKKVLKETRSQSLF